MVSLFLALVCPLAQSQGSLPFVSPVFQSNMVLQRDKPNTFWGWAKPGEHVIVQIGGQSADARAGQDGEWKARVTPPPAGGPYQVKIEDTDDPAEQAVLDNVLVGDVWICSGQSNMEFGIGNADNADSEIANANYPQIRLLLVPHATSFTPLNTEGGNWAACSPDTVKQGGWNGFSAVGYFFGRELNHRLNIPIGLIESDWGGTVAEAWTSGPDLRPLKDFDKSLDLIQSGSPDLQKLAGNPNVTTVLYNGMIAPLVPLAIKGVIWYQGEANAGRAMQYRRLLPAMIEDWRKNFNQGPFPFLIVQLANYGPRHQEPFDDPWADLREAQAVTAENEKNSGLAVTIDIGDGGDIHPKDKQDVGLRLALAALHVAYHQRLAYSGPTYESMKRDGSSLVIRFGHTDAGLLNKGDRVLGFQVAGSDGKFFWADAKLDGNRVVVSSPQVADPTAVRYAWDANPEATLYNGANLPAVPFRASLSGQGE